MMRHALASPLARFLLLYGALYAAYGAESPFLPAYMRSKALTPADIGLVFGAGTLVRLVAGPLFGRLADRLQATRGLLVACAAASAAVALGYTQASRFSVFLLISVAHSFVSAPLAPMADSLALASGRGGASFDYGWVRGAGSAAFIAGTLLTGRLIAPAGLGIIVPLSAGLLAAAAVAASLVPVPQPDVANAAGRDAALASPWTSLLRNGLFLRTMAVAMAVIGSHALNDTFAVIRWSSAGLGPGTISLLWSESVLSEVVVFLVLGRPILARLGASGAASLAAAMGVVRWAVMSQTTSVPILAIVQSMHGLTFALMHLVAVAIIVAAVPSALATTAQTAYNNLCLGVASAILVSGSGMLYGWFGAKAFWAMALLCAAALPLAATLKIPAASIGPEPSPAGTDLP